MIAINKLTDDLLIHIISFLPTRCAVQTCLLSKRWKHLWRYASCLHFDDHLIADTSGFIDFVDRAIDLNRCPMLQKFTLRCLGYISSETTFHRWINKAMSLGTKEFCIEVDHCSIHDPLPPDFYASEKLQALKFKHVDGVVPLRNFSFPNLKILHYYNASRGGRKQEKKQKHLFNRFQLLEELVFEGNVGCGEYHVSIPTLKRLEMKLNHWRPYQGRFVIYAPNVTYLHIEDDFMSEYIIKEPMPCLFKAKIKVGFFRKENYGWAQRYKAIKRYEEIKPYVCRIYRLLRGISSIRHLKLSATTMFILNLRHYDLPLFFNLTSLRLRILNYACWNLLNPLLRSAPNLKDLIIEKDLIDPNAKFEGDSYWLPIGKLPNCLSMQLQYVEIRDCEGHQTELRIMEYLLRNGKALNSLKAILIPGCLLEDESRFRERISKIPKVNSTCLINIEYVPIRSGDLHRPSTSSIPPRQLTIDDLQQYTDGFSKNNFIDRVRFGSIYRGKNQKGSSFESEVTVKIWEEEHDKHWVEHRDDFRYQSEVKLLGDPRFNTHPNFAQLLGFCSKGGYEASGLVYEMKSLNILKNLIRQDSFTWLQRIKVALKLACTLEYVHRMKHDNHPCVIHTIYSREIMLDQDCNPVLLDAGLIHGHPLLQGRRRKNHYFHPDISCDHCCYPVLPDQSCDVYQFGVVLLELITRRGFRDIWSSEQKPTTSSSFTLGNHKHSLVHQKLMTDPTFYPSDGPRVTGLALQCIDYSYELPSMKAVVKKLLKLQVVSKHLAMLESNSTLSCFFQD